MTVDDSDSTVNKMSSNTEDFSELRKSTLSNEIISNRGAHSSVKMKSKKLMTLKPLNLNSIKKAIEEGAEEDEKYRIYSQNNGESPGSVDNKEEIVIPTVNDKLQPISLDYPMKDVTDSDHETVKPELRILNHELGDKCVSDKPINFLNSISVKSNRLQGKENKCIPQKPNNDSFDLDFSALSLLTPVKQSNIVNTTNVNSIDVYQQQYHQFITPKVNNSLLRNQSSLIKKSVSKAPLNSCNKVSSKNLLTPSTNAFTKNSTSQHKIWSTKLENQCLKSEASNSFPAIPIKQIEDELIYTDDEYAKTALINTPKDETFKRIIVNNIEYIMFSLLGKGGSSEVYQCYNLETKVHVAIKCVSLQNSTSASGYINEVKLLQQLQDCDKIIKMIDFEILESQKKLLVVLEKGGKDLSTILKQLAGQKLRMPMYKLLFYWMEMLYAVRQIHSHGIIHSDLKPANFLKVDEDLKLIDFGIASSVQNDMTSVVKTTQEGSCNYISPEALKCDSATSSSLNAEKYKIHFKSDVWSLGCILYQIVYGRTPFQHITQLWPKLAAIMNPEHKIDYPSVNSISPKIIDTIKKCLQYNVKSRPSIDELIAEYEALYCQ